MDEVGACGGEDRTRRMEGDARGCGSHEVRTGEGKRKEDEEERTRMKDGWEMAKEEDPTHDEEDVDDAVVPTTHVERSETKEENETGTHVHAHPPTKRSNVVREKKKKKKNTNHHESNGPDEGCASTRRTRETARRNDSKGTWSWTEA